MESKNRSSGGSTHTTSDERQKYAKMWATPDYRRRSPGLEIAPAALSALGARAGQSLIDYGCGDGKAVDWFRAQGLEVTGVDIVALRPDVTEACLWELPPDLSADFAFCADVMEHLPPNRIADVLAAMKERTRLSAALTIATIPCRIGERFGEKLHLTVRSAAWWHDKLLAQWSKVERHETDRPWRPLFICS